MLLKKTLNALFLCNVLAAGKRGRYYNAWSPQRGRAITAVCVSKTRRMPSTGSITYIYLPKWSADMLSKSNNEVVYWSIINTNGSGVTFYKLGFKSENK